jgi:hypothetical protein
MNKKRYPLNVAGPFYVEDGCCTACGIPEPEAPDLLGWELKKGREEMQDSFHCYFKKQPESDEELEQAFRATMVAEFRCFRYDGSDPKILTRLTEMGESAQCDALSGDE